MLQLTNIKKSYQTASFTQTALNGISLNLRDNEFVAILGPSGSGKTTLLNIIGGLDHYDSGDLIIDGISTKQYKDRDWDAYRNNRIGFVFQSYNLIPHQSILANVEMALTLSGVSKEEREKRAREALSRVGLADHINKRPNQLSGGQMQRVAIARALINDPEILLADEPTGALDSKTSVQIMDLLTEIARDRLVVMVTHNPELAEQYATRIVNLQDGNITSDSDPYTPSAEECARMSKKKPRYTSMSGLTALSLSFNNLMTKKARTIMTAVAGSIGIIGIAAILALANGVNDYIAQVEEETLSEYPLQITKSSFNIASMFGGGSDSPDPDDANTSEKNAANPHTGMITRGSEGELGVSKMITSTLNSFGSNDLAALKKYLDSGESGIEPSVSAIEYSYNVTPQIFNSSTEDGVHQVNPDTSFSALGFGGNGYSSIMNTMTSTNVFYEMPTNSSLYINQYDIVSGRWPQSYNEVILVTSRGGSISDFLLYTLGIRDPQELSDMISQFNNNESVSAPNDITPVAYETILNTTFKLVHAVDYYQYDSEYGVWVNKSDNEEYMKDLVENGETLHIVGIVKPKPESNIAMLQQGINYPAELTHHIMEVSAASEIVQQQIADPEVNVITGKRFDEPETDSTFNTENLITIDTVMLSNAFSIDASKLSIDLSGLDFSGIFDGITIPEPDASDLELISSAITVNQDIIDAAIMQITADYTAYCIANGIEGDAVAAGFPAWFAEHPEEQAILSNALSEAISIDEDISDEVQESINAYIETVMSSVIAQISSIVETQLSSTITQAMQQLSSSMMGAFRIDEQSFAQAFQFNMTAEDLSELIGSMMTKTKRTYNNNLVDFGYANIEDPSQINIYPIDFENKEVCINVLDSYNNSMKEQSEDDKVIVYTDIVGALMASVTEIVNMISMVLIAFVAISLVVSSIMIGVITYISVLERIKEIGILRAIGASKKDISHVFNAETIIEGFISGIFGVGITAILCVVANIVLDMIDKPQVAQLPIEGAVILVFISIALTFIAGVIPARSASKKDPVEALRSE